MAWPIKTIEVEDYEGWRAELYELTLFEAEELSRLLGEDAPVAEVVAALLESVKSWTFTSREGMALPVERDSLSKLPPTALNALLQGMMRWRTAPPLESETSTLS